MDIRPNRLYIVPVVAKADAADFRRTRIPNSISQMAEPRIIVFQQKDNSVRLQMIEIGLGTLPNPLEYNGFNTLPSKSATLLRSNEYCPFDLAQSVLPEDVINEIKTLWNNNALRRETKECSVAENPVVIQNWILKNRSVARIVSATTSSSNPLNINNTTTPWTWQGNVPLGERGLLRSYFATEVDLTPSIEPKPPRQIEFLDL